MSYSNEKACEFLVIYLKVNKLEITKVGGDCNYNFKLLILIIWLLIFKSVKIKRSNLQ